MKSDLTLGHEMLADAMSDQGFKREAIERMKSVRPLEPASLEICSHLSMDLYTRAWPKVGARP